MSFSSWPALLPEPAAQYAFRWICHPACPPPLPEALRPTSSCDAVLRVPKGWSLLPGFDRPSTNLPLFVIPYSLEFEIGPQTFRKTFAFRFTAVTRLACLSRSLRHKTIASLSGHPDCTMNLRPPSIAVGLPPIVRHDLRHAVKVNRTSACLISAPDSRRMVLSARTFQQLCPWIPVSAPKRGSSSGRAVIVNRRLLPESSGGLRSTDNHKTRCDLRHALDCDLVAVTSRTLSQSARAALSFELLFVRSIAGPPCVLQSLFPARLQLAADSRRPLRQPSCASNLLSRACAQPICFGHSVDPYVCRVFRNALGFPLAFSRVKRGFHRSSRSQVDELTDFRRFVLTG